MPVQSFMDNRLVTIYVGESETAFQAHMTQIGAASPVLKGAFTGKFKESTELTYHLPDHQPQTFDYFLQWTYCQSLELSRWDQENIQNRYQQLVSLYALGDFLLVKKLQNQIIDKMFETRRLKDIIPDTEIVLYVYGHTHFNSPLRKLLTRWYVYGVDLNWYNFPLCAENLALNPEFAADIAISFAQSQRHSLPNYHLNQIGVSKSYHVYM